MWQGTIPVYINNFNHLSTTRSLVEYFASIGQLEPIVVDNHSDYEPLLDWYEQKPCKVIRLTGNFHYLAPWYHSCIFPFHVHREFFGSQFYAVTDSDLDMTNVPKDVFEVLVEGIRRHPGRRKCGVSLDIESIPDEFPLKKDVQNWEHQWWQKRVDSDYWDAGVDTTLAVYRADKMHADAIPSDNCLRSDKPYMARHVPWHWTPDTITDENRHYLRTLDAQSTMWSKELVRFFLGENDTSPDREGD